MREDDRKVEARSQERRKEVRGVQREGGGVEWREAGEVEIIKCQSVKFGITRVSNMEEGYWQVSLTYIVRKLEKLQAETSLSTFK